MRGFVGALVIIPTVALVACSSSSKGPEQSLTVGATTPTAAASAAPSTTPTTLVPLPALGVELAASQIPWNRVGPGWILATWSPAPALAPGQTPPAGGPIVAPITLYLLDPAGGRYAITTFPLSPPVAPGDLGSTPTLADWSGDGRHALFADDGTETGGKWQTTMTEVDLATGARQTFTAAGGRYVMPEVRGAYSRPAGKAILLSTVDEGNGPATSTLERVDLSGTKQLAFPTDLGAAGKFSGGYLESPDGTQLVFGTANGMVVVGNDGVVGRQLPVPGVTDCSPVRWWTATVILARCDLGNFPGHASQLWQVPLAGGAPTALTAVNSGQDPGPDYGDTDAWQLPSGTFLQSEGACGSMFLSRLTPDMHTTKVTVPDVTGSVLVSGATADKLVLRATVVGCGPSLSLVTYDPAANTSTVLLGPPVNGGSVKDATLYPAP